MQYLVQWEMEFDAESAADAARQALIVHRDKNSRAVVFTVLDQDGEQVTVDLDDEDVICPGCGAIEGSDEYGTVGDRFDGYCPSCADHRDRSNA